MKFIVAVGVLLTLAACATEHGTVSNMSVSMLVLNQGQPFVSREFAERLARLVIDEKYSKDLFTAQGPPHIVDNGDTWSVTFANGQVNPADKSPMPLIKGRLFSRRLTITIRKTNCEVISIT
jgi:hypothetical protein